MTYRPPDDRLIALWQTAPKPDTQLLLQDLDRANRMHQRLNRSVWAIMGGVAILLVFEEATGRIAAHGVVSVIWILSLVIGVIWHRRVRCDRSDALALDRVSLLRFMRARAQKDLLLARCLYAGVPAGALVGGMVTWLASVGGTGDVSAIHPQLHMVQTGAGVAALIIMVGAGAILARSRRLQVDELSEKLQSMKDEM